MAKVVKGDRLDLTVEPVPPPALKALIEACWNGDPAKRPNINSMFKVIVY
jgi:hypothetical protein